MSSLMSLPFISTGPVVGDFRLRDASLQETRDGPPYLWLWLEDMDGCLLKKTYAVAFMSAPFSLNHHHYYPDGLRMLFLECLFVWLNPFWMITTWGRCRKSGHPKDKGSVSA